MKKSLGKVLNETMLLAPCLVGVGSKTLPPPPLPAGQYSQHGHLSYFLLSVWKRGLILKKRIIQFLRIDVEWGLLLIFVHTKNKI